MAEIKKITKVANLFNPIYGIRPAKDRARDIIAPPYDVLNSQEARELVEGKPWSFLHVSKPEVDFPCGVDVYSDAVYQKASDNFKKMLDEGVLIRDEKPCFYAYRLQMGEHIQTGLVVGAGIEDYDANRIKKHEFTRPVKEEDRAKQIRFVKAQTGPGIIAYKQIAEVNEIIKRKTAEEPEFSVEGMGGVIHTLWVLDDEKDINTIVESFEKQEAVYIADGHHRSAAASRVRKYMLESRGADHTGTEPYNSYLAVAFPVNEMKIWDYNRVVKDLNGLSSDEFMAKLKESFEVKEFEGRAKPTVNREYGMYLNGKWYMLKPIVPTPSKEDDPVLSLDISVLSDLVLDKILGIKDLRKSDRIDFVGGIRGLEGLEKRVNSGEMKIAFAVYPTSIEELIAVADDNQVMPPKSTWFEPKLADGMVSNPLL
ncbi:MAG: DUF1015 domain-containing protein [Elusimicrobia bacterium]|nr:DUF1015 domain-containing protein [Elusimicrobiota bacterium]